MTTDLNEKDYLCHYDPRRTEYEEDNCFVDKDDIPTYPVENCSCDNCFYGRTELALCILKLKEEKAELLEVLEALGNLEIKGHSLLSRLQFSKPDRALLHKVQSVITKAKGVTNNDNN